MPAGQARYRGRMVLIRTMSLLGRAGLQANLLRKIVKWARRGERLETLTGFCTVCGHHTRFVGTPQRARESYWCWRCCASARNRAVAAAVLNYPGGGRFGSLREWAETPEAHGMHVWQMQAQGPIHWALRGLPGYVGTEFLEGIPSGAFVCGIRIEDAQATSFRDAALDLVISEDVLEHVSNPLASILEVRRILKLGGWCILSVPLVEGGTVLPQRGSSAILEWHEDPLGGVAPVFTRWGKRDVCDFWEARGFHALVFEDDRRAKSGGHQVAAVVCQRVR